YIYHFTRPAALRLLHSVPTRRSSDLGSCRKRGPHMQFQDKTFIVTGGASGLGASATAALLERGAAVFVADVKGEAPEGATFVQTDVTDEASVTALVEQANANGN